MASNRSLLRAVARASSSYASRSSISQYTTSTRIPPAQPIPTKRRFPTAPPNHRPLSSPSNPPQTKLYNFEKIKTLIAHPSPTTLLIDVREPHEYAQGFIPTALNLPIQSQPDALFLSEAEFEDRFGFAKPGREVEVVFYCKAGVRSRAAAVLAGRAGWERVGEYPGSWGEWVRRGGEGSREGGVV